MTNRELEERCFQIVRSICNILRWNLLPQEEYSRTLQREAEQDRLQSDGELQLRAIDLYLTSLCASYREKEIDRNHLIDHLKSYAHFAFYLDHSQFKVEDTLCEELINTLLYERELSEECEKIRYLINQYVAQLLKVLSKNR